MRHVLVAGGRDNWDEAWEVGGWIVWVVSKTSRAEGTQGEKCS